MDSIKTNWNIITGAPCSGKSATIEALAELQYEVVTEGARELIEARQRMGHSLEFIFTDPLQMQKNIIYFTAGRELHLKSEEDIFLENSPISAIAYAIQQTDPQAVQQIQKEVNMTRFYRYNKIFILDQLDINQKDEQRIKSINDAKELEHFCHKVMSPTDTKSFASPLKECLLYNVLNTFSSGYEKIKKNLGNKSQVFTISP